MESDGNKRNEIDSKATTDVLFYLLLIIPIAMFLNEWVVLNKWLAIKPEWKWIARVLCLVVSFITVWILKSFAKGLVFLILIAFCILFVIGTWDK